MKNEKEGISFSLINLDDFSGLFQFPNGFPEEVINSLDSIKCFGAFALENELIISELANKEVLLYEERRTQEAIFIFLERVYEFAKEKKTSVCCNQNFISILEEYVPRFNLSKKNKEEQFEFQLRIVPINNLVLSEYCKIIFSNELDNKDLAIQYCFLNLDETTTGFLRIVSRPPSIQDLIMALKQKLPLNSVTAIFSGGYEWYNYNVEISKAYENSNVEELAIWYSKLIASYKKIYPEYLAYKFAFLATSKKLKIWIGYMISYNNKTDKI